MNIATLLKENISRSLNKLYEINLLPDEIILQPTKADFEGSHTFVTFNLSKSLRISPVEIANALGENLLISGGIISKYNVVQGFLNLTLSDKIWLEVLKQISLTENYGFQAANHKKIIVEYSSPNTNKPLHLGHLRNNFLGYAVAEILKANGYEVVKANIVNDRGIHICKSMLAYQKFGNGETPESANMKGDHLVGKYYVEFDKHYKAQIESLKAQGMMEEDAAKKAPLLIEAQNMLLQWEQGDEEVVGLWKKMNSWVYAGFNDTYKRMGVDFDKFYFESDTYLLGKDIVKDGLEKGVFFKKENGSVWVDLTPDGLDQKLLLRSDGTSVYITQDLGLADLKYKDFAAGGSIYVVGNEQDYHFKVLFLILKKLGRPYAEGLFHLSYGMVDLPSGKMKSREGTVVDADDLMEEVVQTAKAKSFELSDLIDNFSPDGQEELFEMLGVGAIKYFLLKVDPSKRMLFNPEESVDLQGNTAAFIQYSHARIKSIMRKAAELELPEIGEYDLADEERDLIVMLNEFPEVIKEAGARYAPYLVAQYCFELAKAYNRLFASLSIFKAQNIENKTMRVFLSLQTGKVIKTGMKLLGINVPEKM